MSDKKSRTTPHLIWKGALFGIANIIPGVSGGTMAVITGVYDDFMNAIPRFIRNWLFLVLYLGGAVFGIVGGSFTIQILFEKWPAPTMFLFMGFILGGIPMLLKTGRFEKRVKPAWAAGFLVAFALVILMSFILKPGESEVITEFSLRTALFLVGGGALAASAMVIPGISGSFLMLLIGLYSTFVAAVTHMNIPFLVCIATGVAAGILLTARIMTFFLQRFHQGTYAVILGLVTASIVALWPGIPSGWMILSSVLCFAAGLTGGYLLGDK